MTECNQSCVDVCVVPDCYNLSIVRGTYNRFQIILTDGDNKAIAINNDTVEFIIKDDPGGSVIVLSLIHISEPTRLVHSSRMPSSA